MGDSSITLQVKWGGNNYTLSVDPSLTVKDVKEQLQAMTHVAIHNQKIMGWLPKGKIPDDHQTLQELHLKSPHKLMLVGTAQQELEKLAKEEDVYRENMEIERALEQERQEQMTRIAEQMRREEEERRRLREEAQQIREEEWRRRQEEHRLQMEQEREQMEVDTNATISMEIEKCHSIAFSNSPKSDFEFSDKIVLPNAVLEEIIQKRLELPLTLRLSSKKSQHITHAGVLDFTAPANTAYIPFWMMSKLGLDEGDALELQSVKLPKGAFVQLKPELESWKENPSRELLEYQLRNYQSLTTNDTIKIQIKGHAYDLKVVSVRAVGEKELETENKEEGKEQQKENEEEKGISITNTDLNVDIQGLKIGVNVEDLELGEQKEGSVNKDEYVYYSVVLPEFVGGSYVIELQPTKGDPDLYISTKERNPTQKNFTWASQQKGQKKLTIGMDDRNFAAGRFFIGVHGFQSDTKFTIAVSLQEHTDGQALGGNTTQTGDFKICSNCHSSVPAGSLMLHEAQCFRRNFRCPKCGVVMHVDQKEKHLAVAHSKLKCECGEEFEQDLLPLHKEYECPKRLVKCVYCGMEIAYNERFTHQNDCGGRTATCPHCTKIFKRRDMKTHIVEEHKIYPENEEFI